MKGLEKFMVEVFPWRTITILLAVIAACEVVQVVQGFFPRIL